jgi:hypothetical protein
MLIQYKCAIVEIIDLKPRSPGVIQPFGVDIGFVNLPNGVIPDGIIDNQ